MMTIQERRDFLKVFGIGAPAALIGEPSPVEADELIKTRQELFELYVYEAINALPPQFTRSKDSNVVALIEAHAAALAMVLSRMQMARPL